MDMKVRVERHVVARRLLDRPACQFGSCHAPGSKDLRISTTDVFDGACSLLMIASIEVDRRVVYSLVVACCYVVVREGYSS